MQKRRLALREVLFESVHFSQNMANFKTSRIGSVTQSVALAGSLANLLAQDEMPVIEGSGVVIA